MLCYSLNRIILNVHRSLPLRIVFSIRTSNWLGNDKCFIAHHLFNHKTTWIKIAIESTIGGGEL